MGQMTKRRMYLFSLMMATLFVLLSTVILHHHHYNRICFVEQKCEKDGNTNDEHTEHHEKEQKGCSVHQMHHFLVNAKLVKSIYQHIWEGGHVLVSFIHSPYHLIPHFSVVILSWQEPPSVLLTLSGNATLRRGPPCLS